MIENQKDSLKDVNLVELRGFLKLRGYMKARQKECLRLMDAGLATMKDMPKLKDFLTVQSMGLRKWKG